MAVSLAAEAGHAEVTGAHMLLAILLDKKSHAAEIMKARGVDFPRAKALIAPARRDD